MDSPKTYRSKPTDTEAIQWTGSNADAVNTWLGPEVASRHEGVDPLGNLHFWCQDRDRWVFAQPGEWIVRDKDSYAPMEAQTFHERWTDDDQTSVSFTMKMVDGDQATVTVDGFTQAATAARALIHCGSPDVVMKLLTRYAEQGDMSVIALANELGELAEKKAGLHKS